MSEQWHGSRDVVTDEPRVISERVARAAARALLAANEKLGVESDAKTKRLAAAR
ncbi:MAG: hypothetical protein JJD92_12685 [Frankiaceae bacterium]|nr:hypothetical protein [Frankiaceae bacterium]